MKWRGPYVPPVGSCCGRNFYTWEGWHEHQRSHRSRYNLVSPYDRRFWRKKLRDDNPSTD